MMHKPELKAGLPLDIVFENEVNQQNAHYLKAVIYDYDKNLITLSQTSPALTRHFLNRRIIITFLVPIENRILRFGFPAQLIDVISHYAMASENTVEALLVKKFAAPEPTDFRMYFRVRLPSTADICLFLEEQKVSLLDISIGGAKFTYPQRHFFRPGDAIKFKLVVGQAIFNIDAAVRSVREPDIGASRQNIQYVSVEFRHNDQKMEASLAKAILDIERGLLSEGKI